MTLAHNAAVQKAPQTRLRPIRVFALVGDANATARERALGQQEGMDVRIVPVDVHLGETLSLSRDADVILIDADLSDAGHGAQLEAELRHAAPKCPMIVRATSMRLDAARRLMRLEAAEVIETDMDVAEVASTIFRVLGSRRPQQAAKVSAFFSPRGGVGVTTLAVETAVLLATAEPEREAGVCLVDLNLEYGLCAPLLNLTPNLKSTAQLLPNRIDDQLLDAFAVRHKLGLSVLSAEHDWSSPDMNVEGVTKLLDVAAGRFQHLVVDLPKSINPVSSAVLASADHVFLVTDLTVPGLQLARSALAALDARMNSHGHLTLIVNRVARRGGGASLSMKDVSRFVPCRRISMIYEDTETASEATDRGEPIARLRPDSRIAREIREAVSIALPASATPLDAAGKATLGLLNIGKR